MSRANELNNDDWNLIVKALEVAAVMLTDDRMRHLATDLRSTYSRAVCVQCEDYPADLRMTQINTGLCGRCANQNHLASLLPEEFDDDASQDAILENAVHQMSAQWENAKKLREQVERAEGTSSFPNLWFLRTVEIRNLMGWTEKDDDGGFTRYYFEGLTGDKDE